MPESVNLGWARDSIQTIQKTSSSGLKDTYTMTFKSGSQFVFEVTNGATQVASQTFQGIVTPTKWQEVRAFIADRFDAVLGAVLTCTNGMKYRLQIDIQDDSDTPKNVSIFYHNGASSSAPFTENDAVLIYASLFSSSAAAGVLYGCDVTILYCNESATEAAVPESRTIAGINLEDDITKAELQNALGIDNLVPNIQGTSLSELISLLETDNGILLAEDNNHWYYFNGTTYVDGGLYQKTLENNPAITKINGFLDDNFVKTNNVLQDVKIAQSSFFNENGYNIGSAYISFNATYPIAVKPNTTYKMIKNGEAFESSGRYDALASDKSWLSLISTGLLISEFTTPANCYFVVLTFNAGSFNDLVIVEKNDTYYHSHLRENSLPPSMEIANNVIEDIFVNKTKIENTNINYTTGNAEENEYFVACNFIEVEPETTYHVMPNDYKLSQVGNMAFYNENKQYISGQQSVWQDFTTPANCKYVRFSVYIWRDTQESFSFNNAIVVKGNTNKAPNSTSLYTTLNKKKWVVIGDSITEINYRACLHYHDYIGSKNNMNVVNMGIGGTGYINRQAEDKAFYQRALNAPTDADIITIFGGVNDCLFATAQIGNPTDTGTTTWCGCVNQLITNLRSLYVYCPLGIISPLPCDWTDEDSTSAYDTQLPNDESCRMSEFVTKLKKICELRSVPFLDLFHTCGLLPNTSAVKLKYFSCGDSPTGDGLHPNSEGHKLFASKIENFIKGIIVYDS